MTEEKVLNLPMRKVHALKILRGEKVREYRACTDHWAKILGECNDPKDPHQITDLKHFDKVHFYPYNKSWYLDCKFKAMILTEIDDEFIRLFGKEYAGQKGDWVFVIRLDGVIETNLSQEG